MEHARGADTVSTPHPERGWWNIELSAAGREHPALQYLPSTFEAFQSHRQGFALPNGCTSLASSEGWSNQIFALDSRTVGVQFHPEFTADIVRRVADSTSAWEGPFVRSAASFLEDPSRFDRQHSVLHRLLSNLCQ